MACRLGRVRAIGRKSRGARPPRKASSQTLFCPYRKPTPVGEGKYPQVDERTSVKELGKLTPYLWKKGSPSSCLVVTHKGVRGTQERGSSDCLAKTQVSAKAKAEVYGLTPAQCRKVNQSRDRSGEGKPR